MCFGIAWLKQAPTITILAPLCFSLNNHNFFTEIKITKILPMKLFTIRRQKFKYLHQPLSSGFGCVEKRTEKNRTLQLWLSRVTPAHSSHRISNGGIILDSNSVFPNWSTYNFFSFQETVT